MQLRKLLFATVFLHRCCAGIVVSNHEFAQKSNRFSKHVKIQITLGRLQKGHQSVTPRRRLFDRADPILLAKIYDLHRNENSRNSVLLALLWQFHVLHRLGTVPGATRRDKSP